MGARTNLLVSAALSVTLAIGVAPTRASAAPADEVGADWAATFEADAVASYVGDARPKLIVVPAGDGSGDAAAALRAALTASGSTSLVMDSQAIGAVAGLDDAAIVARATSMPVDQIVIVRVFDGGPEQPPNVVVTFYAKDGAVTTALTGAAGTPVAASEGAGASDGVTEEAASAVSEITEAIEEESEAAAEVDASQRKANLRRYKASYLWYQDYIGVRADTGAVVASWTVIRQGDGGAPVKGGELYRILGRDDLLRQYQRRTGIRYGVGLTLLVGGAATAIAGSVILVDSLTGTAPDFGTDDPIGLGSIEESPRVSLGAAGAIMGVGSGLMIIGSVFLVAFKSHPVSRAEAGHLIQRYNENLRDKLGLPELEARLRVRPLVGPVNGVGVRGQF